MITRIGELIERVIQSVKGFGIDPMSEVVVRVGDFGAEMQIEHLKVTGGLNRKIVLQVRAPL
jgi:hypothetical protein